MDVAFCPECKKAGLNITDKTGFARRSYGVNMPGKEWRWCPRCGKWIHPNYRNVMAR